jgi:hypothetical protein
LFGVKTLVGHHYLVEEARDAGASAALYVVDEQDLEPSSWNSCGMDFAVV